VSRIRNLITLTVSVAALAVPTVATAAVTYDDASVGSVGKGKVQSLFGWNDATFQEKVKSGYLKFYSKHTMSTETRWQCGDGVQSRTSTVKELRALDVTLLTNAQDKVTGFTLNGIDQSKAGDLISAEWTGAPDVEYCPAGDFVGFLPDVFTSTVMPGVYVNGWPLR